MYTNCITHCLSYSWRSYHSEIEITTMIKLNALQCIVLVAAILVIHKFEVSDARLIKVKCYCDPNCSIDNFMTVNYTPITLDFNLSWIVKPDFVPSLQLFNLFDENYHKCLSHACRPQRNVVRVHVSYHIKLPEQAKLELIQITYNYIWGDGIDKAFRYYFLHWIEPVYTV